MPAAATDEAPSAGIDVRLGRDPGLDERLRGRALREAGDVPGVALDADERTTVVAGSPSEPLWTRRRGDGEAHADRSALALAELGEGEALRDRFRSGRFLALLPVLELLRAAAGYRREEAPPGLAAFVLDDPNLHWPSYGHVRYDALASSAARSNYHVAMATIPLDGWLVHAGAARRFRGPGARLSLAIHGNDHVARELGRPRTAAQADRLLGQALVRVARLERRAGLRVARVMVPPHGACSEQAMRGLARHGFEGVAIGRPFPWFARSGDSPFAHPGPHRPLTGWHPADVVAGGAPVLMRQAFSESLDDLTLGAYLDRPAIVYGHHGDLAGGLDLLEATAAHVNSLREVRWCGLDELARGLFGLARDGDVARVTAYARRLDVPLERGARELALGWPKALELPAQASCSVGGAPAARIRRDGHGVRFDLGEHPPGSVAEIRFAATPPVAAPGAAPALWPVVRRLLSEGRDRVEPVRRRPAATAAGPPSQEAWAA